MDLPAIRLCNLDIDDEELEARLLR
jgi:hypothetical protein